MNRKPFFTQYSEMSKLGKVLCVALFVAGIIVATLTVTEISANNSSQIESISVSSSAHGPGREYGAIYGSVDPGLNSVASAADPFPSFGTGHDYGAIYGSVDPGLNSVASAADPFPSFATGHDYGAIYGSVDPGLNSVASAADPFPSHGTGHDYGAIYGSVDPGLKPLVTPPPFIVNINGQWVVRRSELGPLTQPVEQSVTASQTSGVKLISDLASSSIACQSPVTYTIAGVTLTRCSEQGPLSGRPSAAGQKSASLVLVSDPLKAKCAVQPTLTYSIAGVTSIRRSELGPLTDPAISSSQACVP